MTEVIQVEAVVVVGVVVINALLAAVSQEIMAEVKYQ